VNASLIDGETDSQIWSDRFDHDVRDVAAFQDEVTGRIVNALGLELVAAEARKAQQAVTTTPDAIDLSMRGWWLLRQPADREKTLRAREMFERALVDDPHSVPALLGKATALSELVGLTWSEDSKGDLQQADDAVTEVLALSPQNAATYYVKCQIYFSRSQLQDAIDACQASIARDRNYAPAYGFLAALSRLADQPERTVALLRQAMLLSPRDPNLWMWVQFLGRAQSDLGHQDEAVESFRRAIAINPGAPAFQWTLLSTAYARAKRPADAREAMNTFLRLSPHLMEGKPSETVKAMRVQIELALRGYYLGIIDGDIGKQSRRALVAFQRDQGIAVSEQPDEETISHLGVKDDPSASHP
jgi:tetratricopeptide (TPR) repeat protein